MAADALIGPYLFFFAILAPIFLGWAWRDRYNWVRDHGRDYLTVGDIFFLIFLGLVAANFLSVGLAIVYSFVRALPIVSITIAVVSLLLWKFGDIPVINKEDPHDSTC